MSVNWKELQKPGILVSREVTLLPRLTASHFELRRNRMEITVMYAHNEPLKIAVLRRVKLYYNLVFMLPKYT
jgi:hypothetical protein